jgi:hypothetical protein
VHEHLDHAAIVQQRRLRRRLPKLEPRQPARVALGPRLVLEAKAVVQRSFDSR